MKTANIPISSRSIETVFGCRTRPFLEGAGFDFPPTHL
jgi:hypothetical protein